MGIKTLMWIASLWLFANLSEAQMASGVDDVCENQTSMAQQRSPALLDLKQKSISDIEWNGQPVASEHELSGLAMQDIRAKWHYFNNLGKQRKNWKSVTDRFEDNRQKVIAGLDRSVFDPLLKTQMHSRLAQVKLDVSEDFLSRDLQEMNFYFTGWKKRGHSLEMACQHDGLLLSAFYYKEENVVILCPGTELRLMLGETTLPSLDFLLSHEISHAIDTRSFPDDYGFLKTQWNIPESYANESAADYWAASAHSIESSIQWEHSLALFCGLPETSGGFANYLSGEDRIQFILDVAKKPQDLLAYEP
ncbi:MAG: hypothetical protein H6626_06135 [Pseudobdellovibrionaceae bacterium]|nr:hypothetical protein [Bdellovibrionales bacterium]USN48669.1 MAG: hypothetical protein H6626_06135 [Pseudobdellovibrionaceae bacterium]